MEGLGSRIFLALALASVGALLGIVLGELVQAPALLGLLGAAAGIALGVASERRGGARLMDWLRGEQGVGAPRDEGFWGELAYRIERALRQRENQVREERERLQQFLSAIEASPNGVLLLDPQDQISWCNQVAADHFGLDPRRDLLQRVTNLVRMPAFVAHLQNEVFDEPVVFAGPGGRSTLSVLLRPYGQGQKLVLSQDITERERADAMRRDFVANVSHEIRTPLTVLAGFVETLSNLPLSEVERSRVLALMAQQTDRMQMLVSDLLTLAQLEGSPRPAPDQWVSVAPLMRRAQADAQALSRGRHRIDCEVDEGAQVAGSEPELLSAIANLLNNAVRYTPEGGSIELRWIWREVGAAAIEVRDSGIGISREHLPRLTERFYRVDGSRSRDTGGTGLGLSIVKHVVQRHGGQIDIQSEPGRGSTFVLEFPSARVRRRLTLAVGADDRSAA